MLFKLFYYVVYQVIFLLLFLFFVGFFFICKVSYVAQAGLELTTVFSASFLHMLGLPMNHQTWQCLKYFMAATLNNSKITPEETYLSGQDLRKHGCLLCDKAEGGHNHPSEEPCT